MRDKIPNFSSNGCTWEQTGLLSQQQFGKILFADPPNHLLRCLSGTCDFLWYQLIDSQNCDTEVKSNISTVCMIFKTGLQAFRFSCLLGTIFKLGLSTSRIHTNWLPSIINDDKFWGSSTFLQTNKNMKVRLVSWCYISEVINERQRNLIAARKTF